MKSSAIPFVAFVLLLFPFQNATAVEVLSAKELASHCKEFPRDNTSLDGEFCARYIQGFIDGSVATDARVMLSVEADLNHKSSWSERVMKTRMPNRSQYQRAARYAEFCLGDPILLKEVVTNVVNDLNQREDLKQTEAARDFVYTSLKKNYPCEPE